MLTGKFLALNTYVDKETSQIHNLNFNNNNNNKTGEKKNKLYKSKQKKIVTLRREVNKRKTRSGAMAHACNPSTLGG